MNLIEQKLRQAVRQYIKQLITEQEEEIGGLEANAY
jgi:hypothetical protein